MTSRTSGQMDWQDAELIERFRILWMSGLSRTEIGNRLGCSKNSIISKSRRLDFPPRPGDTGPRALPSRRKTTPEQEARIREKYARGMRVRQLAKEEGVADHVIDRVLGFPNRGAPARPVRTISSLFQTTASVVDGASKEREIARLLRRGVPKDVTAEVCGVSSQMVGATARMLEPVPVRAPAPIHVVRQSSCLWPTGTRTSVLNTYGSCGNHAVPGKSYCVEHHRLGHQPRRSAAEAVAAE